MRFGARELAHLLERFHEELLHEKTGGSRPERSKGSPDMKNFSMKKLYYSISEVSRITDLEQYVLRYWETEFDQLTPAKNSSGNRIYTNKDIKLILLIKKLLKEEKYTIEGAKKILKNYSGDEAEVLKTEEQGKSKGEMSLFDSSVPQETASVDDSKIVEDLREIRTFLEELYNQLDQA